MLKIETIVIREEELGLTALESNGGTMINPLQARNANFHFMELETLKDLYIHQLKNLQSAKGQLVKALPQIAKTAH